MKLLYSGILFFISLISVTSVKAQYLEFTENKGQWDAKANFGCDMGGSAFFLQKQGYRVNMANSEEFKTLQEYYGGHGANKVTGKQNDHSNNHGGKVTNGNTIPGVVTPPGLHSHAYEVTFVGSNPNPTIVPEKPIDSYNNYYIGNDKSKWAPHCKIYQAVTYKNVYPNIDVRYYTNNGTLKYDIIINPGGDITKIALRFDGTDGLTTKNGNLIIKTSVGNVTELSPLAYQFDKIGRKEVDAKFAINGTTVYFKTGNFLRNSTFIIDPTLIFASLTKSLADNWGYTATYDSDGNFYAGGIVFGKGYPTANGPSYQTDFNGGVGEGQSAGYDAAIIKLDARGRNKIFATYLGGAGNEQPHSMVVDNNNNLIVAGRTNSDNFPNTIKGLGPGGQTDIFLAKFTADGSALVAATKIGGALDDGINIASKEISGGAGSTRRNYGDDARSEVICDGAGNIYLASCTQSSDVKAENLLSTPGAFQPTFGGGTQDGLLIKTGPGLNILFSSYLGGKNDDAAFVLALNPLNNDIYVGGGTTSSNFGAATVNAAGILHSSFSGGDCDGFITIISNDGSKQIRSAYVGGPGNDMVYGVQFDKFGYPYIMGTTTVSFPITGNVGFTAQAKGRQFITKLSRDLAGVEYSTNFGKVKEPSKPDISPTAFLVDRCENVYVSGWGGGIDLSYENAGTDGLSTYAKNPADVLKKVTDGEDFYFFVLEKNAASQLYGSYYGEQYGANESPRTGDHVDGGTSRFDRNGVIYQAICANCFRTPSSTGLGFPVSGNVWGPKNIANSGASCNEAAVKIAFELAGVAANLKASINGVPRDTSGCIPLTVDFTDTIHRAKQYIWSFGDGSPVIKTTSNQQSHTYNNIGDYTVMLVAIDSMACNIADTVYTHIRARDDYAQLNFSARKLLPCNDINYQFVNKSVAPRNKPFTGQSFEWNFGDGTILVTNADTITHRYAAQGTYEVVLKLTDTNYCNAPDADSIKLRIATNVKAQFNIPTGCAPYNAVVNNTSLGGQQFFWNFGDGTTSQESDPVHLYQDAGTYTVSVVVIDSSTCNIIDSTKGSVIVGPKPKAGYFVTPLPPQEDVPATFHNTSTGGTLYKWEFGDGALLTTTLLDTPVVHQYIASTTYEACLYTYNEYGCVDTLCTGVEAIITPLADVPSAFTPNGDNVNDVIHVKSFGVVKMDWKIYNRWGVLVFQSTSPTTGWDGYYKGVLQPQEVYAYVLNIVFSDNKTYQKKGDITLLR